MRKFLLSGDPDRYARMMAGDVAERLRPRKLRGLARIVPSGSRRAVARGTFVLIFLLSAGVSPPLTAQAEGDGQSSFGQALTPERATLSLSWQANGILDQSRNADTTGSGSGRAKADFTLDFAERLVDVSTGTGSGTVAAKANYQEHTVLADTSQSCEETRTAPDAERNDLVQLYVIEDQDVPGNLRYRIDLIVDIQCEMNVSNDAASLSSSNDFQIVRLSVEGSFPRNSRSVVINTENLTEMSWPFLGFDYLGGEYKDVVVNGVLTLLEPATLALSPAGDLVAVGPDKAGRFTPAEKRYVLKNTGGETLEYKVASDQPWAVASPEGGTLAAGSSAEVNVAISAREAGGFKGLHKATITFVNATNGAGSTSRQVWVKTRERWRVVYTGYQVFYHELKDEIAGGVKLHYRTVIEFEIEGGTYKWGKGSNRVTKIESYSNPPGIWDCLSLEGYPWMKYSDYPVRGVATGSTVKLSLPVDNEYRSGYTCLLDTDALKNHLKTLGKTKFPSIAALDKTKTLKGELGVFPYGLHEVSLKDYRKPLEEDKFQGLILTVSRIR